MAKARTIRKSSEKQAIYRRYALSQVKAKFATNAMQFFAAMTKTNSTTKLLSC